MSNLNDLYPSLFYQRVVNHLVSFSIQIRPNYLLLVLPRDIQSWLDWLIFQSGYIIVKVLLEVILWDGF